MEQVPKCNFKSLIRKYNGRHGWPRARPNVFAPLQYGVANLGKGLLQGE